MSTCQHCKSDFEATKEDTDFLLKINPEFNGKKYPIPSPKLCPDCRQQRRLIWRNERNLYQRICGLCKKSSLSIYREDLPFPVYCINCWWSDKWDPKKYAKDFDFNQSFFEQFKELQNEVPRMMAQQSQNDNSEYTANVSHLKNCYLLFSSDFNKDCYYGVWIENSQDSLDNFLINKCQLAHESIFSDNIYNCSYVIHSSQCTDSAFLMDCKNCNNCFMCYGLRNKEYCIANKQYTKEEYEKTIDSKPISSYKNYQYFKNHYFEMIKDAPYLYMWRNGRIEDSTGNFLTNVKNCINCYDITEGRDCKNTQDAYQITDAFDCSYVHGELGYENCECFPMPMKSAFNMNCYLGNDLYYNDMCMNNNSNLFGCVSLKKEKYCIFNKQYTPEEYENLAAKIVEHMQKTGEYGEFFSSSLTPFHYNETNAQDFQATSKEEAIKQGFTWMEKNKKDYKKQSYEIPDDINETEENICEEILACTRCKKNYKIVIQEYKLLKKLQLPIPHLCFECRHEDRLIHFKERKLHQRQCHKCEKEMQTNYLPENPKKVYCEECYMKEVY